MKPSIDYLVVGAGFAGSVIAERLAAGRGASVCLIDRRSHVGGNAYDRRDAAGILIHQYGPHIFHTNSSSVFRYLSRFTAWRRYEHRVLASVDGQLVPVPINRDTVRALCRVSYSGRQLAAWYAQQSERPPSLRTAEDAMLGAMGRFLYEKLYRGYTRKQWGRDPSELNASLASRVRPRTDGDDRYFTDRYQGMPREGYTRLFENMLDHARIRVELGVDYRDVVRRIRCKTLIYTGPIDEYFSYRFGALPYRSLRFEHRTLPQRRFQAAGVVNYPNDHAFTRITEFKYLTGQAHAATSIAYEFPTAEGEPFYPVPAPDALTMYQRYRNLAEQQQNVVFLGRLATYKYLNMDQVVAQSLAMARRV